MIGAYEMYRSSRNSELPFQYKSGRDFVGRSAEKENSCLIRRYGVALLRPAGVWEEWTAPSSPKALDRGFHFETIIEKRISLACSKTHPFFGRSNAKPNELRGLR